jgi:acyl-CoA reductase-like NAD-dependent aldehyde dehydrogenase
MSTKELKDLLERIEDTREIVLGPAAGPQRATGAVAELHAVWDAARTDARVAYEAWRAKPGAEAFAVYRAAADRVDAAEAALAAAARGAVAA